MDPDLSRGLALALLLYGRLFTADDRLDLVEIAEEAGSLARCPAWFRELIAAAQADPMEPAPPDPAAWLGTSGQARAVHRPLLGAWQSRRQSARLRRRHCRRST